MFGNISPAVKNLLGINNDWRGVNSFNRPQAGTTIVPMLRLANNFPALATATQQASSAVEWRTNGWRTFSGGSTRTIDFDAYITSNQGTNEPIGEWRLDYSVAGATAQRGLQYFTNIQDGASLALFRANALTEITVTNSSTIDTLQNLDLVNPAGNQTHFTHTYGSTIRFGLTSESTGSINYRAAGSNAIHNHLFISFLFTGP